MTTRRAVLIGGSGFLVATAGCLDLGDPDEETEEPDGRTEIEREPATAEPSYHLSAAPVEANDGLDPVLTTDDDAVADLEPLMDVIQDVTQVFQVVRRSISIREAEAFEALTAEVEPYYAGNPPGYYFGHEGRRISVILRGG